MVGRTLHLALILLVGLALGCEGTIDLLEVDPATGETNSVDPNDSEAEELPPPFELSRSSVQLLPFHVRLAKISNVTGAPESAPIFDELRAARYDLGDHNYAQGIGPDLQWNASKMALWVESLRPVCQSEQMRQRYPFLPEHLNELLTAAYGREATRDDLELYDEVLAETAIAEPERYEAVCLAVLTSTEFVAR